MLASASAITALSILVLGNATSLLMVLAYAMLYGIGWGIRIPLMGALQEATAQHFDELLTPGKAETENVSKRPRNRVGVRGFEPPTT